MRKNKITKNRMALGEGAFSSLIKSPVGQKQQLLNAFSLAEAMIVLLVATIALGMSAPMISRQLKNETANDIQFQVLRREIEKLKNNQNTPKGAVMFFDLASCPDGWDDVSSSWNGRFIRIAGSYDICDKTGVNNDGSCKKTIETVTNSVGTKQDDASRRIKGRFPAGETKIDNLMNHLFVLHCFVLLFLSVVLFPYFLYFR